MGDMSDDKFREQWTVNFQEELAKLYTDTYLEISEAENLRDAREKEEYLALIDIAGGIIAI